jgi:toxin ParE1/3/4
LSGRGRFRLAAGARRDIAAILAQTVDRFGAQQHATYAALLRSALGLVAQDPVRPGSRDRSDLIQHMRSFPVGLAAKRRSASSHVIFYVPDRSGGEGIFVVRVLHQAMDPRAHLPEDAG